MKLKLMGVEKVQYKNKADKLIDGVSLHVSFDKEGVAGQAVGTEWIGSEHGLYNPALNLKPPCTIDLIKELLPGSRFPTLLDIKVVPQ